MEIITRKTIKTTTVDGKGNVEIVTEGDKLVSAALYWNDKSSPIRLFSRDLESLETIHQFLDHVTAYKEG